MSALSSPFESLYLAFSSIKKPRIINGCPCCIQEKKFDVLLSKPLRELTSDDLNSYCWSAFFTVGSKGDYTYLLPRILEITLIEESFADFESTGKAISNLDKSKWTKDQKDSFISVFFYSLEKILNEESYWKLDGFICGCVKAGLEISPLLKILEDCEDAVLEYYGDNAGSLPDKLSNLFWEKEDNFSDILKWFRSDKVSKLIEVNYGITFKTS